MGLTGKKRALIVSSVGLSAVLATGDTSTTAGAGAGIASLILIAGILGLYFLPTIVAALRHHHNTAMIAILNFFLGWTFIGWVIFLAMSFGNPSPQQTIIHNVYSGPIGTPTPASAAPVPTPINTTPTV
jgi:RsiW-degrading membrane proteinase PrsW (M82 family)